MKIKNLTKNNYKFNSIIEFKPESITDIKEEELQFFPAIEILLNRKDLEIVKDEELKEIAENVSEIIETTEQIKPKRGRKPKKEVL